jgi:hypothetical protein
MGMAVDDAGEKEASMPALVPRDDSEPTKIDDKYHFNRIFVAFKPCIDGFLASCRPYIGVDATTLNSKYVGQLASATDVDGYNWLYYVAYAVFDSETTENWTWFMQ